jgi:hypothetical protein
MAVSRQLDRVRVEQNHCQGLHTDNASYSGTDKIRNDEQEKNDYFFP